MCTIGGFIGELILAFVAMQKIIRTNPDKQDFTFDNDSIEQFISDNLAEEFPPSIAALRTSVDFNQFADKSKLNDLVSSLSSPAVQASFGLGFLLENATAFGIEAAIVKAVI